VGPRLTCHPQAEQSPRCVIFGLPGVFEFHKFLQACIDKLTNNICPDRLPGYRYRLQYKVVSLRLLDALQIDRQTDTVTHTISGVFLSILQQNQPDPSGYFPAVSRSGKPNLTLQIVRTRK
jgi:hypothetical protein